MSPSSEQRKTDIHTPISGLHIQDLEKLKDEDFWEYARQRARATPEPSSHTEYLECKLDNKSCLVALRDLAEVIPPPHRLASLPGMPDWMVGIIAWRGETIAVIDLDRYLHPRQEAEPASPTSGMLLVASQEGRTFGLLVPAIGLTTPITAEQIISLSVLTDFALAEKGEIIAGTHTDLPILNISALLVRLVQQIGIATNHG